MNVKQWCLLTKGQTCLFVQSPDVELVEPEVVLVKEEMVEASMSAVEESVENVQIIGDDGNYCCLCIQHYPVCRPEYYKSIPFPILSPVSEARKTTERYELTLKLVR